VVLAADDYPPNLHVLVALLEPLGIEVVTASCGTQAAALTRERKFAAILLDVRMPGLSGPEVAALVRSNSPNEQTPILLLAGDEDSVEPEVKAELELIAKPYNPSALVARVQALVAAS
jgi:CheY-like chemotaxis protein